MVMTVLAAPVDGGYESKERFPLSRYNTFLLPLVHAPSHDSSLCYTHSD